MRRLDLTHYAQRASYQPSLWGDTYLTPQEAAIYLQQMLQTLKRYQEKTNDTSR